MLLYNKSYKSLYKTIYIATYYHIQTAILKTRNLLYSNNDFSTNMNTIPNGLQNLRKLKKLLDFKAPLKMDLLLKCFQL